MWVVEKLHRMMIPSQHGRADKRLYLIHKIVDPLINHDRLELPHQLSPKDEQDSSR